MLAKLEQLLSEIAGLNHQLILLVGPPHSGKTSLLRRLGATLQCAPLNVSLELGRRLAATPLKARGLAAGDLLRDLAAQAPAGAPLLLDNLELLFEPSLHINPLDLIRQLAHARRVVAVWPGEVRGERVLYADLSHPEHRDYSREGLVLYEL